MKKRLHQGVFVKVIIATFKNQNMILRRGHHQGVVPKLEIMTISYMVNLKEKHNMEGLGGMGLIGENFEGNLGRVRGDENKSRSGGSDNLEGESGDEQDVPNDSSSSSRSRRQKYHRQTSYQIQELEA
ncbi:hypothetical protein QVD17_26413 [Tagetes erecta]|uniref:Uncharacterized protein n=1 Tax=Tagetes erecta TaxID=13708 RepID=A0AAD8NQA2_TARER|nr:hypothetical protein QVD17_26413 [Tagetes erecta]